MPLGRRIGSAWDAFSVRPELIVLALATILVISYLMFGGS